MLRKVIGLLILIVLLVIIFHGVEYLLTKEPKREPTFEEAYKEELKKKQKELRIKVPMLIKRLNAPREMTREIAIRALAQSEDPRAIEPLAKVMLEDKVPLLRKFAAECLSEFRDKRAIPHLKKALKDKDKEVQLKAAESLFKLGDESAEAILINFAKEGYESALRTLCIIDDMFKERKLRNKRAKDILKEALNYNSDYVRAVAAFYLAEFEREKASYLLPVIKEILEKSKDYKSKDTIIGALERIGTDEAVLLIGNALDDEDRSIRDEASRALTKLKREDILSGHYRKKSKQK